MLWSANRSKGFTLVELLIGASLSAAVMAAVLSSYIFLGRSFTRLSNQQILETEARRTLATFAKDVQGASGLTDTANLSASRLSLTVPSSTGTDTITYYYNSGTANATVSINGTNVTMLPATLTRCVYNGSAVSSLVLLRNVTDNDATTTADLFIRYYDASGNAYTGFTDYLSGIKQLALEFSTQNGVTANGTRTLVQRAASSRLQFRNSALLQ